MALGALALALLPNEPTLAAPPPAVVDLGYLPPYSYSEADFINDAGQVAGYGYRPDDFGNFSSRAILWDLGELIELPVLPGEAFYTYGLSCWPTAINARGQVVGSSETYDPEFGLTQHGVLWHDGQAIDLPPPTEGTWSTALDINDAGVVVGLANHSSGERHVMLWTNGEPTDLGPAPNHVFEINRLFINNAGQVAGYGPGWDYGILSSNGKTTILGQLPGYIYSVPNAINNRGQIMGSAIEPESGFQHAWVWHNGAMTTLSPLPTGQSTYPNAINTRGQVVGWSDAADPDVGSRYHAVLWNTNP